MPAKAGKKDASKQGGGGGSELERMKRLILERARETRKEFTKCSKIPKSAEKFKALLKEVPDAFKTELVMVRLSLLEGVADNEKKRGSKLSQEIDDLCTTAVNLQPCWVYAMEKCATLLRAAAMLPERAQLLVHVATNRLERAGGRPTDDKVFFAAMDTDQEMKLERLLDLDGNEEDVERRKRLRKARRRRRRRRSSRRGPSRPRRTRRSSRNAKRRRRHACGRWRRMRSRRARLLERSASRSSRQRSSARKPERTPRRNTRRRRRREKPRRSWPRRT
ncbi:hypothetical protein T484DRAFT_1968361 [Baffinella frigidus]|nr:hypothetical protein T484DRAFT_1968361 [Cryptophyta sp. CCMP2293]